MTKLSSEMVMLRCQRSWETFKIGKFTKPRHTDKESNGLQDLLPVW